MRGWAVGIMGLGSMMMAGCETFDDYMIASETGLMLEGAIVRLDTMETFTGDRYDQFRVWNGGSRAICAQVVFNGSNNYAGGGYSMGSVYSVAPGTTVDIGYVQYPANYGYQSRLWTPQSNGACGSYEGAAQRKAAGG